MLLLVLAVAWGLFTTSTGQTSSTASLAIEYVEDPTKCPQAQYLDTSKLQCSTCPLGSFPSTDQRTCVACDSTNGTLYDFRSGLAITQSWSPAILSTSRSCACRSTAANATVLANYVSSGTTVQRCVVCPFGTRSTSSSLLGLCVPSSSNLSTLTASAATQLDRVLRLLGIGLSVGAATQAFITVPSTSGSGATFQLSVSQSKALLELLGPSAYSCYLGRGADRASCNAVANLCALQMYDSTAASCRLYDALVSNLVATGVSPPPPPSTAGTDADLFVVSPSPPPSSSSGTTRRTVSTKPETGAMPWLYYGGNTYLDDRNMNLRVEFSSGSLAEQQVSHLTFLLSAYALNGTWLGYTTWTSQLQLCGAPKDDGSRWSKFGWNYENTCTVQLEDLFSELGAGAKIGKADTLFYELWLRTSDTELYPIPVKIANKDELDNNEDPEIGAVRRFFFVDSNLGYSSQTSTLQAVQYPSSMELAIVLRRSPRDSIYIPQLTINYLGWQVTTDTEDADLRRDSSFTVSYNNEGDLQGRFWYAWRTVLIVILVVMGLPAGLVAVFRYMRRTRDTADFGLLIYIGICIADYGSFALAFVLLIVSLYYLILIKLQEQVYFLMMPDHRLENFRITVILAVVGQSLAVAYMIWQQIRADIFFLDWEKPRKVISKEGVKEEPAPVSAWRMLMVANEWNELQTTRVTHPAFTLIMLVMILEGAGVINAGYVTPEANDFKRYANVTTSIILRFGVEAAFFLVLFLGQYLFKKLIYYPYVANPVTQFVDLMYLANISALIFDDSHSGYYIHGRNQAQHSDTTLRQLNQELLKEEDGLTAARGLVTTATNPRLADNQLFLMYVTDSIRKTYDAKMLQLVQQATNDARNRKGMVSTFLKGSGRQRDNVLSAQEDLAQLFKQMVDDVERNSGTQVIEPNYLQMVLQLPPDNSLNNPCFVHDWFNTFASTIFLGSEVRLYVFEALLFLAIDMDIKNVPVTALIVFLINRVLAYVRSSFGEDNMSSKTLVDRHFLI